VKHLIRRAAALAAVAALAACPLPQQVAEYPNTQRTPPRILTDSVTVNGAKPTEPRILVPTGCATAPTYALAASVRHVNLDDKITARWFVDYVPDTLLEPGRAKWVEQKDVPTAGQQDPNVPELTRVVPAYLFSPYGYASIPGPLHVVELVVSNDIAWPDETGSPLPYRSTSSDIYETQVYRWVFLLVDPAANPGVTCP
jgi:hypothetical protein